MEEICTGMQESERLLLQGEASNSEVAQPVSVVLALQQVGHWERFSLVWRMPDASSNTVGVRCGMKEHVLFCTVLH